MHTLRARSQHPDSGVGDTVEALPDVSKELPGPLKFPGCSPCRAGAPHCLIWSLRSRLLPASRLLLMFPWEQQPLLHRLPQPPSHIPAATGPTIAPLAHLIPRLSPGTIPCMRLRCSGWQLHPSSPRKMGIVGLELGTAVSPALFSCRFYSHSHSHQISHGPEAPRLQGLY